MLRLTNVTLPLHHADEALPAAVVKRLRVTPRDLVRRQIVRRGHDARDKQNILLVYTVNVTLRDEAKVLARHGGLQARIADPRYKLPKTYLVQVEGEVAEAGLAALRRGLRLKDGMTRPAAAERIAAPALWPRDPPVRFRKSVPDCWLTLTIGEGKNRQVRRMTAAIGHPTLRLVRWSVGDWTLDGVAPGGCRCG